MYNLLLGSRSLLPVIGRMYRFGALSWLSSRLVAVSQMPVLRLAVFFVSQKVVTRPGIDEGYLVICVGESVTRVDKIGILLDFERYFELFQVLYPEWVGC